MIFPRTDFFWNFANILFHKKITFTMQKKKQKKNEKLSNKIFCTNSKKSVAYLIGKK